MEGWIKANFDGSFSQGLGGGGVIVRKHDGNALMMAGREFEVESAFDVELKAAWLVVMATHRFFRESPLHLEGGSQDVVKLMKENNNVHSDVLILVDI